jgi:uncharacterized membrane protein
MFLALLGVLAIALLYRKTDKNGKDRRVRIRRRTIQLLAVSFIVPAVLILALDGILVREALATLLGTFLGYVPSGIGEEERASGGSSTE